MKKSIKIMWIVFFIILSMAIIFINLLNNSKNNYKNEKIGNNKSIEEIEKL